jgi:hypothetical protein
MEDPVIAASHVQDFGGMRAPRRLRCEELAGNEEFSYHFVER